MLRKYFVKLQHLNRNQYFHTKMAVTRWYAQAECFAIQDLVACVTWLVRMLWLLFLRICLGAHVVNQMCQ